MAQQFLSPGVFMNEVDQSFVDAPVPGVPAVIIGRTSKGPALRPVFVGNFDQFRAIFGELDPNLQIPYAARNYLKNSNSLVVVRVLGHDDGTTATSGYSVGNITGIADKSGSNSVTGSVLAVIHHSGNADVVTITGVALDANKFTISIGSVFAATASFQTSSEDYVEKVLNTDPTKYSTYGHYLAELYKFQPQAASASWHAASIQSSSYKGLLANYTNGTTSWVKSQLIGGLEFDLFRLHTRADGRATNDEIKVTVSNVRPAIAPSVSPYGSFDIVVRKFDDTDQRPVVLETFTALNLNEDDRNYVLRRIGDQLEEFDTTQRKFIVTQGTYANKSKYIRAELGVGNIPTSAVPWGFRGYPKMRFSGSATNGTGFNQVPALPYTLTQKDGNGNHNSNICWGVLFVSGGVESRMRAFPDQPTADVWMSSSDADFSLKHVTGTYESGILRYAYNTSYTAGAPVYVSASLQKFTVPFRGGFDGWDLRTADPLYLANNATDTNIGVVSLKRAVDAVSNPDTIDMNMIVIPGVHNLKVTDHVRTMTNDRKDVFFIMDVTGSSVSEAVESLKNREIDDNYVACYYPDIKIDDEVNLRVVRVAPSVGVLGAYAYSDRVGQVWFAPAGLNRGGLRQFGVVDVVDRLSFSDRNTLQDNRINPIGTFPDNGIAVWGQKTLQLRASALDRVNVRRLLIFAKKTVAAAAKGLLFEPNNSATWERFTNAVNPILDRVRRDQGINRFKVVMDSSTNTSDVVDRNGMFGKIFLEPIRSAEYIAIDFVITNSGVQFGD